jgi:hypothetical protein
MIRAYRPALEVAGVLACRVRSTAGPPMASSRLARRSSSATVTGSAGSPALYSEVMASKTWPWAGL